MCGASSVEPLEALQERLGYRFRDLGLLLTALTHSSYANEHRLESNERLEFVGDSVLGMIVAGRLFRRYPDMPEGRMTRLRAELVCEQSLWEVSEQLGLGSCLRLGRGEELTGGRTRPSILADCVEAVLAAMYLDGGLQPPLALIDRCILSRLGRDGALEPQDSKTRLQELEKTITHLLKDEILVTPKVRLVPKGTLAVSDEKKAVRVKDLRKLF